MNSVKPHFSYILGLMLVMLTIHIYAQKAPLKWGKVSADEWNIKVCDFDTSASAIVLCDYGQINFEYESPITLTIHKRIKILKQNGLDQAYITIPFNGKNELETVVKIKAQTINNSDLKEAGTHIVNNEDFIKGKTDEYTGEMRFTMPAVEVGSILEYQYIQRIRTEFLMEDWVFQSFLPSLHSEIRVKISEDLDVQIVYRGDRLLKKYGDDVLNRWYLTNLPAIKKESYCPNPLDYAESIEFQLAGYYKKSPSFNFDHVSEYKSTMISWNQLAYEVMQTDEYIQYLNRKRKLSPIVMQLISDDMTDQETVVSIYNYTKNEYYWNNVYSLFPTLNLNDFLEKKSGSSAEINLLLTALLQANGFDADPLLISTLDHGKVSDNYPLLSQFNHVLAYVMVQGKGYLLDATDSFRPYNYLDPNDINGLGLRIKKQSSDWISLKQDRKGKTYVSVTIDLENDNHPYKVQHHFSGYDAINNQRLLSELGAKTYLKNYLSPEKTTVELDSLSIKNKAILEKPLVIKSYYKIEKPDEKPQLLEIKPIIYTAFPENPFINKARTLPIHFSFPFEYQYNVNIKIPDGYQADHIPEQMKVTMPGKTGSISYMVAITDKTIAIKSNISIHKSTYSVREYNALRKLFISYIDKQKELVVLKKDR